MAAVTAIVTCCKRIHNVPRIWEALRSQSHPCSETWLFYNGKESLAPEDLPPFDRFIRSDVADDHYTRYAVALAAPSDWVYILDDDCIPGRRWVESCLETARRHEGIFAPTGFRVSRQDFATGPYTHESEVGRAKSCRKKRMVEVDVPFSSFFLRRRHLAAMFREPLGVGLRNDEIVPIVGQEDVLLAARAWVQDRARVWLPACPDPEMRGAGEEVNDRVHANWVNRPAFGEERLASMRYEASLGWRPRLLRGAPWKRWWRRCNAEVPQASTP